MGGNKVKGNLVGSPCCLDFMTSYQQLQFSQGCYFLTQRREVTRKVKCRLLQLVGSKLSAVKWVMFIEARWQCHTSPPAQNLAIVRILLPFPSPQQHGKSVVLDGWHQWEGLGSSYIENQNLQRMVKSFVSQPVAWFSEGRRLKRGYYQSKLSCF